MTATGATGIRDSSKRTADSAGLNKRGQAVFRLEKVQRTDPDDDTDDTDHDQFLARIRSLPKPVFRRPPSLQDLQQRENTSSSLSSKTGNSQDNPLVVGDDDEKPGETGGSTRATSVESKIGPAAFQGFLPTEQAKAQGCLSTHTTEPTTEPIDRLASPSAALPQHPRGRVVGEDNPGAAAVASSPSAITSPLSPQSHAQNAALEEHEWEITKIVDKRQAGKGYEYKVR